MTERNTTLLLTPAGLNRTGFRGGCGHFQAEGIGQTLGLMGELLQRFLQCFGHWHQARRTRFGTRRAHSSTTTPFQKATRP